MSSLSKLPQRGVCRFPAPGEGNHFETPWDGNPLVSRLVSLGHPN